MQFRSLARSFVAAWGAIALLATTAGAAAAEPGEPAELQSAVEPIDLAEAAQTIDGARLDHQDRLVIEDEQLGLRIEIEDGSARPGEITPDWSVGVGQRIYVYATGSEVQTFSNYTYTFFSSLICGRLGGLGSGGCAMVALAIWDNYIADASTLNSGTCYEMAVSYGGAALWRKPMPASFC